VDERDAPSSCTLRAVGRVRSALTDLAAAPRQADEGAPPAWLDFDPAVADAVAGIRPGDEIIVVTWLDRADRTILANHPRGDASRPRTGVFATRSPHRPNPLGLHQVRVAAVEPLRLQVDGLEAIDGTPIVDVKGVLDPDVTRR
jgi:tRNA-Thr(GGU) m(6)t(6)A37 methyltransferase TsaA